MVTDRPQPGHAQGPGAGGRRAHRAVPGLASQRDGRVRGIRGRDPVRRRGAQPPFDERFVPRDRWLRVVERTHVAALVVGLAIRAAIALGSMPAALARPPGPPLG